MEGDKLPEGYEAPLHRSVTEPLFWGGVPRNVLISELLIAVVGGIMFKTFFIPIVVVLVHFLFRFLGQEDPYFLQVFWRSKDYKSYYEP